MGKLKNKKGLMSEISASQISLPSNLPQWPNLKVPPQPAWQPQSTSAKKVHKTENDHRTSREPSLASDQKNLRNGHNGADDTSSSESDAESEHDSIEKVPKKSLEKVVSTMKEKEESKDAKERAAAKSEDEDESSSGTENASEEESSDNSDHKLSVSLKTQAKTSSTPISKQRRLSTSSKEKLKDAVAKKHDENKKKGLKPSVEGNVFNARSPEIIAATPARPASASKVAKRSKEPALMKAPATAPVARLRTQRSDAPAPSSPLTKSSLQSQNATKIEGFPTAGPIPPPPSTPLSPSKTTTHTSTVPKITPQIEYRDDSGHRAFSSSAFTKESSPESEAAETKIKLKRPKKKKAEPETGPNAVLAEAKAQAARLAEHARLKKNTHPEFHPPAKAAPSHAEKNATDDVSNQQSSDEDSDATSTSESTEDEPSCINVSSKKRKFPSADAEIKQTKQQKKQGFDDNADGTTTKQSSKKPKKRKRDENNHDPANDNDAVSLHMSKKAKKSKHSDSPGDLVHIDVGRRVSEGKDKKKQKKRRSDVQQDKTTGSANAKSTKSPECSSVSDKHSKSSTETVTPSKKEKRKKQRDFVDATKVTTSTNAAVSAPAQCASSTTTDGTKPDMTNLLTQFKILLPRSALEKALNKLNSDNKDICSKRKQEYLRKSKRKKHDTQHSSEVDYALFDDVTVLTAAKDVIVSLSGTRLSTNSTNSSSAGKSNSASAANMSPMELELGRIAIERQWENERLQKQLKNLQA